MLGLRQVSCQVLFSVGGNVNKTLDNFQTSFCLHARTIPTGKMERGLQWNGAVIRPSGRGGEFGNFFQNDVGKTVSR